jgi:hypothetical protein
VHWPLFKTLMTWLFVQFGHFGGIQFMIAMLVYVAVAIGVGFGFAILIDEPAANLSRVVKRFRPEQLSFRKPTQSI